MSYEDWLAPPAYDAAGPTAPRPRTGSVALALVGAGPVLMLLAVALTIALGYLFPLPVYLAAFLTMLLAPGGAVVAVVGICRNSGRWRAAVAAVMAAPATALALGLVLPAVEFMRSR